MSRPGTFKPGKSGNPKGRPKVDIPLRDLARKHAKEAIKVLVEVMQDKKAPPASRVTAATALLDRGYGRPALSAEQLEEDLDAIPPSIKVIFVKPEDVRRERAEKKKLERKKLNKKNRDGE